MVDWYDEGAGRYDERDIHHAVEGIGAFAEIDGVSRYFKGLQTLECLKEILRAVHLERSGDPEKNIPGDATRPVFHWIANFQAMKSHIIPVFEYYYDDPDVCFTALKVMTALTMPFSGDDPNVVRDTLKPRPSDPEGMIIILQGYKQLFLKREVLDTLNVLMMKWAERIENGDEENKENTGQREIPAQKGLEQALVLVRNLLWIPDADPSEPGTSLVRAQLTLLTIKELMESSLLALVSYVTEQHESKSYSFLFDSTRAFILLECFYYVMARMDPQVLLSSAGPSGLKRGTLGKLLTVKANSTDGPPLVRHSRFVPSLRTIAFDKDGKERLVGQQVTRAQKSKNFKGAQDDYMKYKPFQSFVDLSFIHTDTHMLSAAQNDHTRGLLAVGTIQMVHRWIEEFVSFSFSPLMTKCADVLQGGQKEEYDDLRMMNIMTWVLEFHVGNFSAKVEAAKKEGTDPDIIDATSVQSAINLPAIDLVRETLVKHGSQLEKQKNERKDFWTLIIAFRTLCAQIKMTQVILESPDDETVKIGDVIGQNVVYQRTIAETVYLLSTFKTRAHDPRLLTYSVEVSHRIAKLLLKLAGRGTDVKVAKMRTSQKKGEDKKEKVVNEAMSHDIFIETLVSSEKGRWIIPNLMFLYSQFSSNGPKLNYMLGSLLYQMVQKDDWVIGHFFQLPYMCETLKVLNAARARPDAANFKDITNFARCLVKRFFQAARGKSPFLFVEVLVPKAKSQITVEQEITAMLSDWDTPECQGLFERMTQGGSSYLDLLAEQKGINKKEGTTRQWTPEEDEKLRENWEQFKDLPNRVEFLKQLLHDQKQPDKWQRTNKQVMERLKVLRLVMSRQEIEETDVKELVEANWSYYLGKKKRERDVLDYLSAAHGVGIELVCPSDVEEGLGEESEAESVEAFDGFGDFADLYDDEPAEPPAKRPRVAEEGEGLLDDLLGEDEGGLLDDLLAEEGEGLLDELLAEEYDEDAAEGLLDDLLREEEDGDGVLDELLREEAYETPEKRGMLDELLGEVTAPTPPGTMTQLLREEEPPGTMTQLLREEEPPGTMTQLLREEAPPSQPPASQDFDLEDLMES